MLAATHLPPRVLGRIAPWTLPGIGLSATAAIGLSLLAPGHPPVRPLAWMVLATAAVVFTGGVTATGRRLWLRAGPIVCTLLVTLLVAATGGPASNYQDLFAVLLVASAVLKRPGPLALDATVVLLGTLAPVVYARPGAPYLTDLAIDVGTWAVLAVTARVLVLQFMGARTGLAESDQRFQLLAADVPAVVYRQTLGADARLTWLNRQSLSILGFTPEEMIASPGLTLARVPEEDHAPFLRARRDPGAGEAGVVRYRFDRADGSRIWLEDHFAPVTDEHGVPTAVLGAAFDVSAKVAAEQAQRDAHEHDRIARRELARVLAAQRSFVQGISHELRTPLTAIAGFASVLAQHDRALAEDRRAEILERLLASTRRLTVLVDDLVDIDRLVGGADHELERRPQDVRALVEDAIRRVPTERHRVTLTGATGIVPVDANVLQRITFQLVGNAVRHTPPGSGVRCVVHCTAGEIRLVVEDDGPGVPAQLRSRLFEPFVQGPQALDDPNPGTGIGLALASTLARAHGGGIWYESPEAGGARFVAVLRSDV